MAVREGTVVYVRGRATKKVRFYENGTEQDNEQHIVVQLMEADGTAGDYIRVPMSMVISAEAIKAKVHRQVQGGES